MTAGRASRGNMQMKTLGNTFYGAFTGNGVAFGRPFANNDPIFFRVSVKE